MSETIPILKLNIAGLPLRFVNAREAATLYAAGRVAWEAGEESFEMHGGICRATGLKSTLAINSIIAVRQSVDSAFIPAHRIPNLTKTTLWSRDRICMYCGTPLSVNTTTIEHIKPVSLGGETSWTNCVAACQRCNSHRSNKPLETVGYSLLAVPYQPVRLAEYVALTATKRILYDQMAFLLEQFPANSPLGKRLGWPPPA